ncbi:MAG: pyrroline-5-carboxylate reductase [Candidatus Marinimicrobia bacterium]|mgnify:CR=1 FL=1|jgi:pyrroline-5-carboxylate reductase|nr:pyrroline-5-carboxylate reductase [Candidatus Neomarinimicrobiota bacterium]MBT3502606.1 pyrroline-5-carboxylate reductase [Candidatus Neomarinimicrobiota bacterium]MBT3839260.1 pyrroline-5-carboxylate reductase [Candidatus Neomarinimicrobiota bacterium]MBT3999221.1 pyrroline-5-carboxylate reductase [Candidatus Neomarinimicrobiota bacterium]MBT4281921.1 pyrroline-5-carboxylate reductase [Candidatus Neomarinimicrobiota bacterium]
MKTKISIIGAGNLGKAIAHGLVKSDSFSSENLVLTRRNLSEINAFKTLGIQVTDNNSFAVKMSDLVIVCVGPQDAEQVLTSFKEELDSKKHILISTMTGISINKIKSIVGQQIPIVRVMPNIAVAICESMTCIASLDKDTHSLEAVKKIFDQLGQTLIVKEDLIAPATALCGSGLAFFLRAVRAASQGGTEIGFHAEEAILLAAQTARGAASLTINSKMHPESEIDKVTTPKGITISGLNEMEHQGFSSAMIRAIVRSANKIEDIIKKS